MAGLAVILITAVRLLLESGRTAVAVGVPAAPILNAAFATGAVVVVVIVAAAFRLTRAGSGLSRLETMLRTPVLIAAFLLLWWHLSAEAIGYFHARSHFADAASARPAVLALSWIWAVYAGALVAGGFIARFRPVRLLGVILLAVLVFKVFLLDMQYLERGDRIASFVGVGVLLLVVSLLYQRGRKP